MCVCVSFFVQHVHVFLLCVHYVQLNIHLFALCTFTMVFPICVYHVHIIYSFCVQHMHCIHFVCNMYMYIHFVFMMYILCATNATFTCHFIFNLAPSLILIY